MKIVCELKTRIMIWDGMEKRKNQVFIINDKEITGNKHRKKTETPKCLHGESATNAEMESFALSGGVCVCVCDWRKQVRNENNSNNIVPRQR